ncbi:universal stress protein [Salegentibacter chungangensis]|uniref:Universal stress protein n=1 Tax=Salegentibacter chungangensis TaxID=1335724 RepID=A0ABW3NVA0_9FLAO
MEQVKNILVGLDLSEIDDTLIEYASFIADKLGAEKVYFVHNIKKYEISELFQEQLKDINLEDIISEELKDKISSKFNANAQWDVLISEDPYSEALIKYIVNKYLVNLVILGNKNKKKGTGTVPSKLLRILNCDLLTVPENAPCKLENIWVGTDFSKESKKVFQAARVLQSATGAKVTATHVFSIPVHFSPYINKEDMEPKIEKHVNERMDKFLKNLDYQGDLSFRIYSARSSSEAVELATKAEASKADMLVVADTGGSTISSILVGSLTEELFNSQLHLPLWISK